MKCLANMILSLLEKAGFRFIHSQEAYLYGLSQWLFSIMSVSLLLLGGIVYGHLYESVVLILVFCLNQSYGGGFHADSHLKCLSTSLIGQCVFFVLLRHEISVSLSTIVTLLSLSILYSFPLVLHKNKMYLERTKDTLIRKSRCLVVVEGLTYLIFVLLSFSALSRCISLALLLSSLSRVCAIYINKSMVLH